MNMRDKKIIVGVTGGIAAYKTVELVRLLVREGADTFVAMTEHATRFVSPLTFETISGKKVICDMFDRETVPVDHVSRGQEADLIVVAPATANFISKMAHGMADDFLSTMMLAATAKILVCPSMNTQMFFNPVVQDNLRLIAIRGITVMPPEEGELACHTKGPGRLPQPESIARQVQIMLSEPDLSGLKMLVTAGPTVESIDPVRFITNRSSGRMGYSLARAARRRGASITLVSGPVSIETPEGVSCISVRTTEDMRQAVLEHCRDMDVIIKAAAPLDYRPKVIAGQKIKKIKDRESIEMVRTPDILEELGRIKADYGYTLVGFAAETESLTAHASEKLKKKNLDLIAANDVTQENAGFESDTNIIRLLYRDGRTEDLPLMTKDELADQLLDRIKEIREG